MTQPDRPPGLPDYRHVTVGDIERLTAELLDQASEDLEAAIGAARIVDTGAAILDGLSDAGKIVWGAYGRGAFLALVHPDDAVRDAATAAGEQIEAWRAAVLRRPDLLDLLERLDENRLDRDEAAVRGRIVGAMRRSGAHLDDATRAELDRHQLRLVELQGAFMGNQNKDRATITVDRSRLVGLPDDALAALGEPAADGTVVLPIDLRALVLERVRDRGVREAIHRRWFEVAREPNRAILAAMIETHRDMAALLGASSWAEVRTQGGMIGTLEAVEGFLADIEGPFHEALHRQLAGLTALVADDARIPVKGFQLQDWDLARGLALLRDAHGADGAGLREYLPLDGVLEGLGRALEATFGIRVTESPEVSAWHDDVRRLDLEYAATGRPIGSILLDLLAREGKMPGAAGMCDTLAMGVPAMDDRGSILSHTAVILYLTPTADGAPVLMAPQDIDSLGHELGHALDTMLQAPRLVQIDWAATGYSDWGEAPSQSLGRWATQPDVLAAIGRHVETGAPLPMERAAAYARAVQAGSAVEQMRFMWGARVDLLLHGPEAADLDAAWRAAWRERGTPMSIDTFSPGPLFYMALGYDAAVYGFLWAQVFMDEILGRFGQEGGLSAEAGGAYRREILEPNWAIDPMERMRRFLGREPSTEAFLARIAR